eukprot:7389186-Prymnesium_polylepis.1
MAPPPSHGSWTQGCADILKMARQPTGQVRGGVVPLAADPNLSVTDENKRLYLRRAVCLPPPAPTRAAACGTPTAACGTRALEGRSTGERASPHSRPS